MKILHEERLSLPQAARSVGVNPSTIWRWSLVGVRGVTLETYSIGTRRFTSQEAIGRFVCQTTAAASRENRSAANTPRQRALAIKEAENSLKRQGL